MRDNNRKTRVNDEIKKEVSEILRELKDPRISALTSVLRVETTKDLSNSKIFVSILGEPDEQKKVMEGLKSANGFIRHELAVRINLRNTPELKFIFDDSLERAARINRLIDDANKDD